ncbi:MAG: AMP-binding protein [Burkholderiaceae bacterium]|nr:AMP-binding protein [Burkholderiaceae bacterium]
MPATHTAPDAQDRVSCDLLGDLAGVAAKHWGDAPALTFGHKHWSYCEFATEVDHLTASLQALGIGRGDRVALWLGNCPEYEFLVFAVARVGAILVPLNTRYRVNDLAYTLSQSGSALLVAASRSGPIDGDALIEGALAQAASTHTDGARGLPALRHIVMMGNSRLPQAMRWEDFHARGEPGVNIAALPVLSPRDPVLMIYTSGTTGNPKGVLLDHSGLPLSLDRARIVGLRRDDVQVTYLPLFHTYALTYPLVMSFMCGCRQILLETFDAQTVLDLIERERITVLHGFDAQFNDFLAAQRRQPRDLSSLRFGTLTVGSESSVAMAQEVQRVMCPTLSGYGMTEMWGGITITPPGSSLRHRCEASGKPQPGVELRVVDPQTRQDLPVGQVGEILVRSYTRMIGYHDQPEATAAVFDQDGWFHSGDAGSIDEEGHLRWLARYKDMLKVGGENVSPAEVEALLCAIPGVQAAAVVAGRHERLQEVPVAFVVRTGTEPASEQAVIDHCRGKIASFKLPARVIFVDQLPMTATGKVQKELLRRRLSSA